MARTLSLLRKLDHRAHLIARRMGGDLGGPPPLPAFPVSGVRHSSVRVQPYSPDDPQLVTGWIALNHATGMDLWRWADGAPVTSEAQARRWCAAQREAAAAGQPASFAVIDEPSGRYAGSVNTGLLNPSGPIISLGIALLPEFRGRNVGLASVQALNAWLLDIARVPRLEARHVTENRATCFLMTRIGFQKEGIMRSAQLIRASSGTVRFHDVCVHSFIASDPRPADWPTTVG